MTGPRPPRPVVSRADVEEVLGRWRAGEWGPAEVKRWVQAVEGADPVVREVLIELDLLEVSLLTADDVPALLAFARSDDRERGLDAWSRYRDAIDLDARSRALKRDRFYRPFCR